jgi:hypothetical protein
MWKDSLPHNNKRSVSFLTKAKNLSPKQRTSQTLTMPHIDQILHDKKNLENVPVKSSTFDSKDGVISDTFDCDGEKRIAIIIHTKSGPKHTLRKLFSPLVSTRSTNSYADIKSGVASSSEKLQNNKRSRDFDDAYEWVSKKQKKTAQEALAKLVKKAMMIDTVEEDSNIYDSCPEIVNKVSHVKTNYEKIL